MQGLGLNAATSVSHPILSKAPRVGCMAGGRQNYQGFRDPWNRGREKIVGAKAEHGSEPLALVALSAADSPGFLAVR